MFSESNYTIKEILQQSSSWIRAYKEVVSKKEAITEFFRKSEFSKDSEIILTGAGSSEVVAQTLESIFIRDGYSKARSLPTTSIVRAKHCTTFIVVSHVCFIDVKLNLFYSCTSQLVSYITIVEAHHAMTRSNIIKIVEWGVRPTLKIVVWL